MTALNERQEAFAVAVVKNSGDKVAARLEAGYSSKMGKAGQAVDADTLYNHPKISLRIAELRSKANTVADKKFTVSIEQRLQWLNEIIKAGLGTYSDAQGNERRESLGAADKAISTLNSMLGTDESGDKVKPVKVFVGVEDAS